ncbi:MAG TPA: hypothetical protein VIR27_17960 [Mycobacteriales bacterium]
MAVVLGSLLAIGGLLTMAALAPTFPVAMGCVAAAGFFDGPQLTATLAVRGIHAPAQLRTAVFTTTASVKSARVRSVPHWPVAWPVQGLPAWHGPAEQRE